MTRCPHCDAEVSPSALVCRACNKRLDARPSAAAPTIHYSQASIAPVSVVDINMPFASMVSFMLKWAIAALPAVVLLSVLLGVVGFMLWRIFGGLVGR